MLPSIYTWRKHALRCIKYLFSHAVSVKTDVECGFQLQIITPGRTSGEPNSRNNIISFTPTSGKVGPIFCWTHSSLSIVTPSYQCNSAMFTSYFNFPINILVSDIYWTPLIQLMLRSKLPCLSSVMTMILRLVNYRTSRQHILASYHMTLWLRSTTITLLVTGEP